MDDRRLTFTRVARPRLPGEPWTFLSPFTLWEEARRGASRAPYGPLPTLTKLHEQALSNDAYNEWSLRYLPQTALDAPWVDDLLAAMPPPPPSPPKLGMTEWLKKHEAGTP